MQRIVLYCFLSLTTLFSQTIFAQDTIAAHRPTFLITIKTMDNQRANQVELLEVTEDSLFFYSSKTGEIHQLSFEKIKKISIKKRGGIGGGAIIGLLAGFGGGFVWVNEATKNLESPRGSEIAVLLTSGLGLVVGAAVGSGWRHGYKIKGDKKRFAKFKKQYEREIKKRGKWKRVKKKKNKEF